MGTCDHGPVKNRFPGCNKGYTILELLAVLSLLGLLTALAVPRFSSQQQWQLETASRRLAAEIRLLRQEAINSGETCKMEFYVNINRYTLTLPEGRRHVYLPEGISYVGTTTFSGRPPVLEFTSLGRPGTGGGTVTLDGGGQRRFVIVTPVTGRVRVSRTPPENW